MTLISSLVEYWQLDEASGNRAGAHAGLTLTDNNTVGSATGLVYSNAASFVRTNSEFLSRASESVLQTGAVDFWCAVWVYLDAKDGEMYFVSKSDFEWAAAYRLNGDRFVFYANTSFNRITGNNHGSPSTGVWNLIVVWRNQTAGTAHISVNAGTANSGTVAAPTAGSGAFLIGAHNSASNYMDGRIGPCMFGKDYVPTTDDLTWLYNSGAGRTYADFSGGGGGDMVGARYWMPGVQIYQPRG